jgi:Cu(I)/Ag(I) efflux system membrane fusion protein
MSTLKTAPAPLSKTPPVDVRSPRASLGRRLVVVLKIVQVRLRFLFILLFVFLVVGKWDVLRNYWDRITRGSSHFGASDAVSTDTEYFCPMCPGVLSDWPSKCPVCNMGLVRRAKGDTTPLPDGVVSRMQFSPYRIQLAGIQTSAVTFHALRHEIHSTGLVELGNRGKPAVGSALAEELLVWAEFFDKDFALLREGQQVEIGCEALPGHAPFTGKVKHLTTRFAGNRRFLRACLLIDNPGQGLRPGQIVLVKIVVPANQMTSLLAGQGEYWLNQTVTDLSLHALLGPGRCAAGSGLLSFIHASGQQALLSRGMALALPESALIDTGMRKIVYVEKAPGMFDGTEVTLGPRCGEIYPVLRGLQAGDKVATRGAFLIDAETSLNPSIAAGYFGASRGSDARPEDVVKSPVSKDLNARVDRQALLRLSAADQTLVAKQKICPVTGRPLGSMGTPTQVVLEQKTVFLCCSGCEPELKRNPAKYLAKIP